MELVKRQPSVGVEIGVERGRNALDMLEILPLKKLYLIDPHCSYDGIDEEYEFEKNKMMAIEKLKGYNAEFIFKFSDEAMDDIPDGVDFVYIDGNHSHEFVRRDIENYLPKRH